MLLRERDFFTRLVRARPLMTAAMLYLLGCALQYGLDFPRTILLAVILLSTGTAIIIRKWKPLWFAPLLVLAMLPLGALRFDIDWQAVSPLPEQSGAQLEGLIVETPQWREDTQRCICVLDALSVNGEAIDGRIRLYLRGENLTALQNVQMGQRISCTAHIWRADEATNPGQFNFSNFLRLRGLRGYATAELEAAQLSAPEELPNSGLESLRAAIGARIDRLFPRSADIVRAFVLGDRSELSQEDRQFYSDSGAAHLLSISGMHISALAAALSFVLGHVLKRDKAFVIIAAALLLYGVLIGFNPALTRSILMYIILGFAAVVGRNSDAPTRLAGAMFIHLLVRPVAVLDSSFILSYGASAGLIFLTEPLSRLFHLKKRSYKRGNGSAMRRLSRSMLHWICEMLIATAAAQLAILPAVVHFFGSQPLWSFAVNLVCVPLSMAAYIASLLGLILGMPLLAAPGDLLFALLTQSVRFFGSLPLATLRIARFPLLLAAMCAISVLLASDLTRIPAKLRGLLAFFVIPAVLISNLCAALTTCGMSIVFLDAGQADCAVVRTQGKVYLIDTGDSYTPAADYLSAMNYKIDGVFLSHAHADHAGGLAAILEICTPKRIYLPCSWYVEEMDESIVEALSLAKSRGAEMILLKAGDVIQLSPKTNLRVLSPAAGIPANSANDESMILFIENGQTSALFCGDASASVVECVAEDIDILKVGHHGGKDALNPALLAKLTPSVAVIPVGYNTYGHPAPETLALLEAANARICRTDELGAITLRIRDGGELSLRSHLSPEDKYDLE